MKCALTGTPGVGKTTVSELLEEQGYDVLDLNQFIRENDLWDEEDEERGSLEVDVEGLRKVYEEQKNEYDMVEGHLSHHLSLPYTIVLRCAPPELRDRMERKGWGERKIEENLEAEVLDAILIEALDVCENVYEVDTTDRTPEEVAGCVKEILENDLKNQDYRSGSIDWTEEYL